MDQKRELLLIKDLRVHFGGLRALDVSHLTVGPRRITALIGPNGAGKTTLFNAITGIISPTSGKIHLSGSEITGLAPYKIARLGIRRTFQDPRVLYSLPVRANIEIAANLNSEKILFSILRMMNRGHVERAEKVDNLLNIVDLVDQQNEYPSSLSFGQQRFLSIAIALAREGGKLILLDEPSVGLDHKGTVVLKKFLRDLAAEGPGILLVEHNMDVVMDISDLVVLLVEGKVIASATPQEIQRDPSEFRNHMGRGADATSTRG